MNDLRDIRKQLEVIRLKYPDNDSLKSALEYSKKLEQELPMSSSSKVTWFALANELKRLQGQRLWGVVDEQRHIFDSLSNLMETSSSDGPDLSIIMPTSHDIPILQLSTLPPEILDQINDVYLLHVLATNPSRVLPPGKSLLSIFTPRSRREHDPGFRKPQTLKEQVSEAVTRAFWDEAFESLSSPTPAVQLSRLRLLYNDLHTILAPLIPPSHEILHILSNPTSPTSSPLRSVVNHLLLLLSVLRARCAPIRDAEIDKLLQRLNDSPSDELPRTCVDVIRAIFDLADRMKHDLADFVIGTWTEQDARRWVRREAMQSERRIILEMYPVHKIKSSYREWLGPGSGLNAGTGATRLMAALGSSDPISPFPPSGNTLPPPFMFIAFDLLEVQNLLQGLVIAAALRSLVRSVNNSNDENLLSRVWPLLKMEIDRSDAQPVETKLLNLEDEVVQAAGSLGDTDKEGRLREAVRRTLRTQDPVFVLLQRRLLHAIEERLTEPKFAPQQAPIPSHLRSGHGKQIEAESNEHPKERVLSIHGFEGPLLEENIRHVVVRLKVCLTWVEETWGEFLHEETP